MFKPLNIMLCFLLLLTSIKVFAQDNFKVFYPELIPAGEDFEISIITSKEFPQAERLNIYFIPDLTLSISKIELRTDKGNFRIQHSTELLSEYSEISQKVSIDLTDTTLFTPEYFFQFIVYFKSERTNLNTLKVYGEFISKEKILGYLISSDKKFISDKPNIFRLAFEYYKKYYTASYSANFNQNSYLNIPLVPEFERIMVAEFWMKFQDYNTDFLEIINWETNRIAYKLSIDESEMLTINSVINELFDMRPYFISNHIWYHIGVVFDKSTSELSFLCNGDRIANIKTNNYFVFDNLVLHFNNESPSGTFTIDQFRLLSNISSFLAINRNSTYTDFLDDSSSVMLQINFSESEINSLLDQNIIFYEGISLVNSDAPIFPRAPKLEVKLLNNFYEIEWTGGDFKNVDIYVLERAIGNDDFLEVGREQAENTVEKTYSLISEKLIQSDIIYFRVRQINKDGSYIYSDVVKVGQGIIEDLIIDQNYPNPFNPTTLIEFELLQDSDVEVKVFNLAGKEVALLHKGFLSRGTYQFEFNAKGLSSGIYIYQINTPYTTQTRKMILAK